MKKLVSLYTGVGGIDFGFEAAGFKTAVAVEMDSACCKTLRLNRKWPVIEGDIHEITSAQILDEGKLDVGEADVLVGGPPCQPFSKSSYWVHGDSLRLDDPRADTLAAYLRVLRDIQPKTFLLENVKGLVYRGKDEGFQLLLKGIAEINRATGTKYSVTHTVLNTADYGVPQIRERVFLIGSRDGTPFSFPRPTHGESKSDSMMGSILPPHRNAWDALGDLPQDPEDSSLEVGGKWGDLLPSIAEGENYLWHTNRGGGLPLFGWRTRYWSFLLKLAKAKPSWTIQAQPGSAIGPFHWRNRKLTVAEMCRLQTFPDGLKFECGRTDAQRMLGNAVPSLLAEILAWEIRTQLLKGRKRLPGYQLLPPRRENLPAPERLTSVPKKYLHLQGDHKDHPGAKKKKRVPDTSQGMLF